MKQLIQRARGSPLKRTSGRVAMWLLSLEQGADASLTPVLAGRFEKPAG
jgi:hypothetical protein